MTNTRNYSKKKIKPGSVMEAVCSLLFYRAMLLRREMNVFSTMVRQLSFSNGTSCRRKTGSITPRDAVLVRKKVRRNAYWSEICIADRRDVGVLNWLQQDVRIDTAYVCWDIKISKTVARRRGMNWKYAKEARRGSLGNKAMPNRWDRRASSVLSKENRVGNSVVF